MSVRIKAGGQSSKFDFAYTLYIGRPTYYTYEILNKVSFERNLILTVNCIVRGNYLEMCQVSQSF